jgi:hypothetical protein
MEYTAKSPFVAFFELGFILDQYDKKLKLPSYVEFK